MSLTSKPALSQPEHIKQFPLTKDQTQQSKAYQWSVKTQLPVDLVSIRLAPDK